MVPLSLLLMEFEPAAAALLSADYLPCSNWSYLSMSIARLFCCCWFLLTNDLVWLLLNALLF